MRLIVWALLALGITLAAGCGDSEDEFVTSFTTVEAYALPDSPTADADIFVPTTINAVCTDVRTPFSSDFMIYSETKAAKPDWMDASNLNISKVSLKYTPTTAATPALAGTSISFSALIPPDNSSTFTVKVISQTQVGEAPLSALLAGGVYDYDVEVTFRAEELDTGREEDITTTMHISVADFVDAADCH